MKTKQHNNIKESEIEEAFVSDIIYLKDILNLSNEVKLIARQLRLKSGDQRLDLLIMHGKELCLVELKVTRFNNEYATQVDEYRNELIQLQNDGKLVQGKLRVFLLVTEYSQQQREFCNSLNIELIKYKPIDVLSNYFINLSALAPFLRIKPNDYGVFNIALINRVLNELEHGITKQVDIARLTGLSKGSVHNHLRVAKELGLVRERTNQYFLTDLGDKYVLSGQKGVLSGALSQTQSDILKQFVASDPFYSSVVFGIYSIVESAFILSRNSYPIGFDELIRMFKIASGKSSEWQAGKSQSTATYTFLNYAIDLGLLGKIGKQIVITPAGFRFILMLQLHKSIEMVESLSSNQKKTDSI